MTTATKTRLSAVRQLAETAAEVSTKNADALELDGYLLVRECCAAELENRDVAAEFTPERIADLLEALGWQHDDLLRKVDERQRCIKAAAIVAQERELHAAAVAAEKAASDYSQETARIMRERQQGYEQKQYEAARAIDAAAKIEPAREVLLQFNKLPAALARQLKRYEAQDLALAKTELELTARFNDTEPITPRPNGDYQPRKALGWAQAEFDDCRRRGSGRTSEELKNAEAFLAVCQQKYDAALAEINAVKKQREALTVKMNELQRARMIVE